MHMCSVCATNAGLTIFQETPCQCSVTVFSEHAQNLRIFKVSWMDWEATSYPKATDVAVAHSSSDLGSMSHWHAVAPRRSYIPVYSLSHGIYHPTCGTGGESIAILPIQICRSTVPWGR